MLFEHITNPHSIWKALTNPDVAYQFIEAVYYNHPNPHERRRELQAGFEERREENIASLAELVDSTPDDVRGYFQELESEVAPHVDDCRTTFEGKPYVMGGIEVEAPVLYAALRATKPEKVVEIGVANGVSSYYILSALKRNGYGELVSVDLPMYEEEHEGEWNENAGAWIPTGKDVGWVVPEKYDSWWNIRLGDMKEILPEIVGMDEPIEAFIYDGPKGYSPRKWAFEYVYERTERNCLYFCDDIAWNDSFEEFAVEQSTNWKTYANTGIALG